MVSWIITPPVTGIEQRYYIINVTINSTSTVTIIFFMQLILYACYSMIRIVCVGDAMYIANDVFCNIEKSI